MRDPVADILAERRSIRQPIPRAIVVSIALHAALFSPFFLFRQSNTAIARAPVMIRLEGGGGAAAAMPGSATETAPVPAAAVTVPAPEPKPFVPADPAETTPAPVKAKQTSRKEDLFGQSNAPLAKTASRPSPSPAVESSRPAGAAGAGGAGTSAVPAVGTAGVSGFEGGDFKYPLYVDRMIVLIGQKWFRPPSKTAPMAKVYFEIERDGRIREVKIEQPSGSETFDRSAIRAVREASPLPPLPYAYRGDYLGVHLTFH